MCGSAAPRAEMSAGVIFLAYSWELPFGTQTFTISGEQYFVLTLRECIELLVPCLGSRALDDPVGVTAEANCAD